MNKGCVVIGVFMITDGFDLPKLLLVLMMLFPVPTKRRCTKALVACLSIEPRRSLVQISLPNACTVTSIADINQSLLSLLFGASDEAEKRAVRSFVAGFRFSDAAPSSQTHFFAPIYGM
jgi:hypothetical protein